MSPRIKRLLINNAHLLLHLLAFLLSAATVSELGRLTGPALSPHAYLNRTFSLDCVDGAPLACGAVSSYNFFHVLGELASGLLDVLGTGSARTATGLLVIGAGIAAFKSMPLRTIAVLLLLLLNFILVESQTATIFRSRESSREFGRQIMTGLLSFLWKHSSRK